MGEASSYDGYVGHLAATGVTYINVPDGQGVSANAAVAAGAASAPEPWASAGANGDPLQGLNFGELDVPRRLFDGTVHSFAAGPASAGAPQAVAELHSPGTFNRHGIAGGFGGSQQAGARALQAVQPPGTGQQQYHLQQGLRKQPGGAAPAMPGGLGTDGMGWVPLAPDGYPALVFTTPPGRQHASTRSTSAPQLSAQQALAQQHTVPGDPPPQAHIPQLSSASDLRAGFLQAPPEVQQQLMQEASMLRQQQWQQQQQQHHPRVGQLIGDSPQSSPSSGCFDPRLAHATARLSDFDLSSRANSTNSRFSTGETMTSSSSLTAPLGALPPQPAGAQPSGLATTLGFNNPVGVFDALSAGQQGEYASHPVGSQTWPPQGSCVSALLHPAAPPEYMQQPVQAGFPAGPLQHMQEAAGGPPAGGAGLVQHDAVLRPGQQAHLPYAQWQSQQPLPAPQQQHQWQQQQQQQQLQQLPPALSDSVMRDWAGISMSAGMDWELGERQSPVGLPDMPQPWQGGVSGEWGADVLTRQSASPSAMTQLATGVERAPAVRGSLQTEPLPLPRASGPAGSSPAVSELQQQGPESARSLSPQRTPTKRRSQQRPGRPPKPSMAVALATSQACGGAPALLRQPKRAGARRAASPIPAPPDPPGGSPTASTGNDVSPGGSLGSLVETAAQLGELHAELESGHARVQAAISAVHRGWNNELDFRVSPGLAAELAALPEPERKTHERKERNKQSASAARAKRNEYDAALEALLGAMLREADFYRTVLHQAAPEGGQLQQRGSATSPLSSPEGSAGLSATGSSGGSSGSGRSAGSRGAKKRSARGRRKKAAAQP